MDEPVPLPEPDRVDVEASEVVDGVATSSDPAVEARAAHFRLLAAAMNDVGDVDDLRRRRHIDAALESTITAPAGISATGTERRSGRILAAAAAVVLLAGTATMAAGLLSTGDDAANETADSAARTPDLDAERGASATAATGLGLGEFADAADLVAAYRAGLPSASTAATEVGDDRSAPAPAPGDGGASPVAESAPDPAAESVESSDGSVDDPARACDVGTVVATGTVDGRPAGVLDPLGGGTVEVVFLDDCSVVRPESTT